MRWVALPMALSLNISTCWRVSQGPLRTPLINLTAAILIVAGALRGSSRNGAHLGHLNVRLFLKPFGA